MDKKLIGLMVGIACIYYYTFTILPEQEAAAGAGEGGSEEGNDWRDTALDLFEYVGANVAGDLAIQGAVKLAKKGAGKLGSKAAATAAEKQAIALAEKDALQAAEKAGLQTAEKEAIALAEKDAIQAAEQAGLQAAEKEALALAEKEAIALAEKEAIQVSERIAVESAEQVAEKLALKTLTSRVAGMMDSLLSGPAGWIMLALSTVLYTVLGLDPSMFKPCEEGEWDMASLPAWAQGLIGAIPILGDLYSLIGGLLCFAEKCPDSAPNYRAGLCYENCPEGYKDDGAVMCYKQYGDYWENKEFPAQPTLTSVTKTVLTNTGVPYSQCSDGQSMDAGLCYDLPRAGYTRVGPVAWANITNIGIGRIPDNKGCYDFEIAEGWSNSRDDGTSCWEDWKCNTYCDGNWSWSDGGFCHTNCGGCGCIKKALWDRQYCADGGDLIDGLCYSKCPEGMEHVPGMPYDCRTIGEISYTLGVGVIPSCGPGQTEDSLGLCYNQPPEGFFKTTLGMMADSCPAGSSDFGVGCVRESTTLPVGLVGLYTHLKTRDDYYGITEGLPAGF